MGDIIEMVTTPEVLKITMDNAAAKNTILSKSESLPRLYNQKRTPKSEEHMED
jgi:hypothetical protein